MKKALSILSSFVCPAITLYADEQLVQEKLDLVLEELDGPLQFDWELPDFITNFLDSLAGMGLLFRILFYLFVIVLLAFIIYKTISIFIKDSSPVFKKRKDRLSDIRHQDHKLNNYLAKAAALSRDGDYSLALIQLHKGSCEYLFYKRILNRARDYTNREIFRILKDNEALRPFRAIALEAERNLFRGSRIDEESYRQLETIFMEAFYVRD